MDSAKQPGPVMDIRVSSFRKIPNPYSSHEDEESRRPQIYEAIVDVVDIPDNIPLETNPRGQNLRSEVSRAIQSSLLDISGQNFYLLNRGLLLSAKEVKWNNEKGIMTVNFEDPNFHGNIDGGHTYLTICQNRGSLQRGQQFVKVEILTGVEGMFEDLAEARNHSIAVDKASLAELRNEFDFIKEALAGSLALPNIRFKANEEQPTPINDVICVMTMFNIDRYPADYNAEFPIISYSSKQACLVNYLKTFNDHKDDMTKNPYYKMKKIIPIILELHDYLEERYPDFYNPNGGKRFGASIGVQMPPEGSNGYPSRFLQKNVKYSVAKGLIYPILGSLRVLVFENAEGYYEFRYNPKLVLDDLGPTLVDKAFVFLRDEAKSPTKLGKMASIWRDLFATVAFSKYGR